VIALETTAGGTSVNPEPGTLIEEGTELILVGTADGERRFKQRFT
jgi:K+/H+ antiporter YhaU regulatory subunit KhtT